MKIRSGEALRIFKTRWFSRFAQQEGISDKDLCFAIAEAERGIIDADLGGGVIKQRIARPNKGKSGGFRSIIFYRVQERAFFVFGFAKNDLDNISPSELKDYKMAAKFTLDFDDATLEKLLQSEKLFEVKYDEK